MPYKLSGVQPEFLVKIHNLHLECESNGLKILTYCGVRTVNEQNKIYRQSRSTNFILTKASNLEITLGYRFGEALLRIGPQKNGPRVTNAAGGQSWHNYGYAADSVPIVNGKLIWDTKHPRNMELWQLFGKCVREVGLYWAGDWEGDLVEYAHCQYFEGKVRDVYDEEQRIAKAKW